MKHIALAAAFSVAATSAFAGSHGTAKYDEPEVEPEVIIEETEAQPRNSWIPLLMLALIGAGIAANQ